MTLRADCQNVFQNRTTLEKSLIFVIACFTVALITTISLVSVEPSHSGASDESVCQTDACKAIGASILNSLNQSADPCSDFYSYCCGNWLQNTDMPQDVTEQYGLLEILREDMITKVNDILSKANFSFHTLAAQNALMFYKSCMNTDRIENNGIVSLMNFLGEIGYWPVMTRNWNYVNYDPVSSMAQVQLHTGYGFIIVLMIGTDHMDTSQNIMMIQSPSLTLPNDVLLNRGSKHSIKELRNYRNFFFKIAKYLGANDDFKYLTREFQGIVDFETLLLKAKNHYESKIYRMTIKELCDEVPQFDWLKYLQEVTNSSLMWLGEHAVLHENETIMVLDLPYVKKISKILLNKQYSRQVANYLGWRVIITDLTHLPAKFDRALQEYIEDSGFHRFPEERWKTCTKTAVKSFGNILSLLYIKSHFPDEVRNEVMKLVLDVRFQYETSLKNSSWMDRSTKLSAVSKLNAMQINIGHPDWLFDEQAVDEAYEKRHKPEMTEDVFENALALSTQETRERILKLRDTNTNEMWTMLPVTVNAGYDRNANGITFPAAFLQRPLYNPGAPRFYNYAAIGSIIGHEITHGFDNEGRKRDAEGRMQNWWSTESERAFLEKAECFVKQYNNYGLNGEKTLAENIADSGGLHQSYRAFSQWIRRRDVVQSLPGLEKFTIEQQFFLSYGSMWCTKYRAEFWNYTAKHSAHSPSPFRLRGTVANLPEFSSAFGCTEQSSNIFDRCSIW